VRPAEAAGYIKYEGRFAKDDGSEFTFWFGCDERFRDRIAEVSDGWYVLGVTAAFATGETYRHPLPVCSELVRNSRSLIEQWSAWFGERRRIAIEAVERASPADAAAKGVACLFTSGVDSSFTLQQRRSDITLLVSATFDADLPATIRFNEGQNSAFGLENIVVPTNILEALPEYALAWSYLTHGPTLAGIVHLFGRGLGKVYLSSTHAFGELMPWGSHPLTDPLYSSRALEVVHFGATYSRFDKVQAIASDDLILRNMRVCGQPPEVRGQRANCSRCQKCLRTMAALDVCGVTGDRCTAFVWDDYSVESIARSRLHHPNEYIFFGELGTHAKAHGRSDIAAAAQTAIERSRIYRPLVAVENWTRRRFPAVSQVPVFRKIKKGVFAVVRR
jgi:hypothetical protein